MSDQNKTKAELTAEINALRARLASLEKNGGERRRYDQRMQKTEERYVLLVEQSRDAIYLFYDKKFEYVNRQFEELFDYKKKELCRPDFDVMKIFLPQDREAVGKVLERIYKIEATLPLYEFTGITKDGRHIPIELSCAYVPYKAGMAVQGIVRDITARRQMENELRESRERFKNMVANVPGIIFQWIVRKDGSTNLVYVSESIRDIGLDAEELKKDPLKVFGFFQKEDKKRLLAGIAEAVRSSGHLNWEGPVTINNIIKWTRCLACAREQDSGDIIFDGLILDMTENKRAEEEKKDLEARLQQAQKMEAIGTLAGGIAHDFNNLLMGIQGHTSLMLLDTDPAHSNYLKSKNIEELVNSGANLTKQLLGFARRGRYEIKPSNINDLIDKTATMFGRTKKEILIHRLLQKDIRVVEVDQGQIEQAFLNLYVNAWQAMPGGGDIYLETKNVIVAEGKINQYSLPAGNYVKVSITDTGVGMDEETRKRIFEPFFTTKEMGRGTGLGLATVYGIIKGHNGIINVNSEKGRGTSFFIYLPASDKKIIAKHKPEMSLIKGHETILLVDDEVAVIDVTKDVLESLGYKVISVSSGADAIETYRVKKQEIDIVILDMIMPWLSGSETFDALHAIDSGVKVILSSGYSIDGEAAEIMKKGCRAFIQKPFSIAEISRKIREALEKK